jgi:hypothetical protein
MKRLAPAGDAPEGTPPNTRSYPLRVSITEIVYLSIKITLLGPTRPKNGFRRVFRWQSAHLSDDVLTKPRWHQGPDADRMLVRTTRGSCRRGRRRCRERGGCLMGLYKEPLGGHRLCSRFSPLTRSSQRLFNAISPTLATNASPTLSVKTGRFLDPLIAVVAPGGGF